MAQLKRFDCMVFKTELSKLKFSERKREKKRKKEKRERGKEKERERQTEKKSSFIVLRNLLARVRQ